MTFSIIPKIFSELAQELNIVIVLPLFEKRAQGLYHNTAIIIDADGSIVGSYRKMHIPDEEGFWEADHYGSGQEPPVPCVLGGMKIGLQICSDNNRPFGCQHLAHTLFFK